MSMVAIHLPLQSRIFRSKALKLQESYSLELVNLVGEGIQLVNCNFFSMVASCSVNFVGEEMLFLSVFFMTHGPLQFMYPQPR